MNKCERKKTIQCGQCDKWFTLPCRLKIHVTQVHEKFKPHKCPTCPKSFFNNQSLRAHLLVHSGEKPFPCDICGMGFTNQGNCSRHKKSFHVAKKAMKKCPVCHKMVLLAGFKLHMLCHSDVKPHECVFCGTGFKYPGDLKRHILQHIQERWFRCKICGNSFICSPKLRRHMISHSNTKTFECPLCGKSFNLKDNMIRHLQRHTNEKPYKCNFPNCGQDFCENYELQGHIKNKHGEKKKAECAVCQKQFASELSLKAHNWNYHTKQDRTHECQLCGKVFKLKSGLKQHLRMHTGERPHECKTCGKSFPVLETLRRHIRIHTGERPYNCKECGKKFAHSTGLRSHVEIHHSIRTKNHACLFCPKRYYQPESLSTHIRGHIGERPFSCEVCGKEFNYMRFGGMFEDM